MLGQPALLARHDRGDAQREALLAEQGVAAVAGAVRLDLARLGEMRDRLVGVAGPGHVRLSGPQRRAQRMHAGDELAVVAQLGQRSSAHARHHRASRRRRRRSRSAVLRCARSASRAGPSRTARRRASARASRRRTACAASPRISSGSRQLFVGPGIRAAGAADERPVLDARDVAWIGACQIRPRPKLVVEARERACGHELGREQLLLLLGAVAPVHAIRLEHGRPILDPRAQSGVIGRCGRGLHEVDAGHADPPSRIAINSGR